jgi:hypothetical protein
MDHWELGNSQDKCEKQVHRQGDAGIGMLSLIRE